MLIAPERALHLLHQSAYCALATHAREPAGYPYPTVLPFACDTAHVPLILASALSEHARNLQADSRAGLVVFAGPDEDVLSGARLTLVGEFLPCQPDARTLARYLRYQPEAQRYLDLGDFAFYRLKLERMRYIGGFATMGWITATDWASLCTARRRKRSGDYAAARDRAEGRGCRAGGGLLWRRFAGQPGRVCESRWMSLPAMRFVDPEADGK